MPSGLRRDRPALWGRGNSPLSACRCRRTSAIRMSPCRLRFHPARFPGLMGENPPLLSPCRERVVPCLHLSRAAGNSRVRFAAAVTRSLLPVCRDLTVVRPLRIHGLTLQLPAAGASGCGFLCAPEFPADRPSVMEARHHPVSQSM